jgi:hypothetical protein
MAQVCKNCGEARIDDNLDRCPQCNASLLYTELSPPGQAKHRPSTPPEPRAKSVQKPPSEASPAAQKKRPPSARRPSMAADSEPQRAPQISVEDSEFGREVELLVDGEKGRAYAPARSPERDLESPERRGSSPEPREVGLQQPPRVSRNPALAPEPPHENGRELDAPVRDYEVTERPQGPPARRLKIPENSYVVELFVSHNEWVPLLQIAGMGKIPSFGRHHELLSWGMDTLAEKHARFKNTVGGLEITALESLNGIYLKIKRPVTLTDGTRFRIGDYVLEFREAAPADPVSPLVSNDERFVAQDVVPLAYIDFVRPDDQPGVRFPILKPASTVLGKGGRDPNGAPRNVDVPLLNDKLVSGRHAEIRFVNDHFVIEDLKSTNGTFVQMREPTIVGEGAMLCLGKIYLRVVQLTLQPR